MKFGDLETWDIGYIDSIYKYRTLYSSIYYKYRHKNK
jgi:hypothetical protein